MLIQVFLERSLQDMSQFNTIQQVMKILPKLYEIIFEAENSIPLMDKMISMLKEIHTLKPYFEDLSTWDFGLLSMTLGMYLYCLRNINRFYGLTPGV